MDGAAANISRTRRPTPKSPVRPAENRQRLQPAFGQALKGIAGLSATSTAVLETKSVALSLRVSDTEQARIVACAARANLSVRPTFASALRVWTTCAIRSNSR